MGQILSYSIESGILLIFLYIVYKLTMAGEKQFAANRAVLFSIYCLALGLPLLYPAFHGFHWGSPDTGSFEFEPLMVQMDAFAPMAGKEDIPVWPKLILWVYTVGVVITSVRFIGSLVRLAKIKKCGETHILDNGYVLILTDERQFSPFSFLRYIVISKKEYAMGCNEILIHELTHLKKHHWIDQIAANVVAIFLWYNPAAWLMIEEIKSVHEYQADEAVIDSGTDMKSYQYLLIEKAVGKRFPSPANSLNHSKLKKRITMMYKSKPSKMRRVAGIAMIPAAIMAISVSNLPAVANVISETGNASLQFISTDKINNFSADLQAVGVENSGGDSSMNPSEKDSLAKNIEVVNVGTIKKVDSDENSRTVNNQDVKDSEFDYYVNNVKTSKEAALKISPESIESVDVIKNSQPGQIRITLKESGAESEAREDSKKIHTAVDESAEFPGGMKELMAFLMNNIRYPEEAQKQKIQGRVIVKFVVGENGKVSDPRIVKGVDQSLDDESLRLIKAMPDWSPAKIKGKPVDSYYVLPITFKLHEDTPAQTEQPSK